MDTTFSEEVKTYVGARISDKFLSYSLNGESLNMLRDLGVSQETIRLVQDETRLCCLINVLADMNLADDVPAGAFPYFVQVCPELRGWRPTTETGQKWLARLEARRQAAGR